MHTDALSAAHDRSEAARYALLRRLAPSMRHHLVVNLQPIGMIYEVMDRRLRGPQPDLGQVHESARKMNGFARAALDSCLDVVTWLAPEDGAITNATDGVRECVGLLATSLSFRGYTVRSEVDAVDGEAARAPVRNVLTAALVQATDEVPPPALLRLHAQGTPGGLVLRIDLQPTPGDAGSPPEPAYRPLAWADVQALATADGVELARSAPGQLTLTFPWARPGRG